MPSNVEGMIWKFKLLKEITQAKTANAILMEGIPKDNSLAFQYFKKIYLHSVIEIDYYKGRFILFDECFLIRILSVSKLVPKVKVS